jgi:hypothetical protein
MTNNVGLTFSVGDIKCVMLSVVTVKLVEFEKEPVEVQDFKKITHNSRGIQETYYELIK